MSGKIPVTRVTIHRRVETRSTIDLNREQEGDAVLRISWVTVEEKTEEG